MVTGDTDNGVVQLAHYRHFIQDETKPAPREPKQPRLAQARQQLLAGRHVQSVKVFDFSPIVAPSKLA